MRVTIGSTVEILPGYSMDTGARTEWDDVAGCEAVVDRDDGADLLVTIKGIGDGYWIARGRLMWRSGPVG